MTPDPIESAANEVLSRIDCHWRPGCGHDDERDKIADILRKHLPQWRDRPTCAGQWFYLCNQESKEIFFSEAAFATLDTETEIAVFRSYSNRWYGPIPPSPQEQR